MTIWYTWYVKNYNLKQLQNNFILADCIVIGDLLGEDYAFLTYAQLKDKLGVNLNCLDYMALQIPKRWRELIIHNQDNIEEERESKEIISLLKTDKVCNWAYVVCMYVFIHLHIEEHITYSYFENI